MPLFPHLKYWNNTNNHSFTGYCAYFQRWCTKSTWHIGGACSSWVDINRGDDGSLDHQAPSTISIMDFLVSHFLPIPTLLNLQYLCLYLPSWFPSCWETSILPAPHTRIPQGRAPDPSESSKPCMAPGHCHRGSILSLQGCQWAEKETNALCIWMNLPVVLL